MPAMSETDSRRRAERIAISLAAMFAALAVAVVGCRRSRQDAEGVIEPNSSGEMDFISLVDRATVDSPLITKTKDALSMVNTCLEEVAVAKEYPVSQEEWCFPPEYTTPTSECWYAVLPPDLVSFPEFPRAQLIEVEKDGQILGFEDREYKYKVGCKLNEMLPELGSIDSWGSEQGVFIDWPRMSLGVDFVSRRRVSEVHLSVVDYRVDQSRRIDRDRLEVYSSENNLHYRPVTGWAFRRERRSDRDVIVISNLNVASRYLKIHTTNYDDQHRLFSRLQDMVHIIFADYPAGRWFQEGGRLYVSTPNSGGTEPPAGRYVIRYVSSDERNKSFLGLRRCCSALAPAFSLSATRPVANVLARHATIGKETREVLLAPAPTTLTYTVKVPRNSMLSFGYGILAIDTKAGPTGLRFEVRVTSADGECRQIFQAEPDFKDESNLKRWFDAKIDLSEFEATVADISLCTSRGGFEGPVGWLPVWSTPVLTASDGEDKTSIILVTVCTLRADHLGCYGYQRATSPNIDRYATAGVLFEHAQAQWPQTEPSFASIFTGAYPHTTGVKYANKKQSPRHLRMLPEILRERGYATGAVVANSAVSRSWGFGRGFGTFMEAWGKPMKDWNAQDTTDAALLWLSRNEHRAKLFLWVLYVDTHWPYTPPPPYDERFVKDQYYDGSEVLGDEDPKAGRGFGGLAEYVRLGDHREKDYYIAQYDGELAFLDTSIQPLFEAIDRVSVDRKRLEVFLGDHGETMGEHNNYFTHGAFAYDELLRVPLVIRASGPILKGDRVSQPVALIDVAPTVLEFAGIQRPVQFEGETLLDRLYDRQAVLDGKAYSEAGFEPMHQQTLRMDNFRLILVRDRWMQQLMKYAPAELYDLAFDPRESQNSAAKFPKRVDAMRAEIKAINDKSRNLLQRLSEGAEAQPGGFHRASAKVDQDVLDHLKALGYVD